MVSVQPLLGGKRGRVSQLTPVLIIVGVALVAAVGVIVVHHSGPTVLLPAPERIINGVKYMAVALPVGHAVPQGAILAQVPHVTVTTTAKMPVARAVAIQDGRYGTLAEKIVTQTPGAVAVPTGQFLKGSAPSGSKLARAATYTKAQQESLSKDFADAVKDCVHDGGDNCNNFLHPGGQSLKAFEEDQDRADSGLFSTFERVQHMSESASGPERLPQLAQTRFSFGASHGVSKYGIPTTGSLPGDDV